MATEGGRNILCILDFPVSMVLVRSRHSFQLTEVKFDLFSICPAKKMNTFYEFIGGVVFHVPKPELLPT